MALTQDELGNWYDDGVYETDYGWSPTGFNEPDPSQNNPDYSNEGRGYPTEESTQGSGGSPVNAGSGGIGADLTKFLNSKMGTNFTGAQLAGLAGVLGGGIAGIAGLNKPNITKVGSNSVVQKLQANRNMMTAPPQTVNGKPYRPGQGGVNYGGDVTYTPQGISASMPGDLPFGIVGESKPFNGGINDPFAFKGKFSPTYDPSPFNKSDYADVTSGGQADVTSSGQERFASMVMPKLNLPGAAMADALAAAQKQTVQAAQGGLMGLAHGGRYLQGNTDGMADKLRTSIDGKQPAALSHGEFVIPADVVSHLGNGNSDAGAKKLYSMMDKIREARTGTKKQGKQINPDKFMPGGLARLAQGGAVRHFATGDSVGTAAAAGVTGTEQAPASWTGTYVQDMLGQGQALANAPYQQYQGPLTAGASGLQNQAFNTASNLATPTSIGTAATTAGNIANKAQNLNYTPTTSTFDAGAAQQYMNPYLQASLNPQLAEARRQADITAQQNNAALTKAGAFGGGRQAILTGENQRSLGTNLANITGQGYNTAYQNAMNQFNADQARKMQESQFGANYGLQGLQTGLQAAQAQGGLGATQNQTELANLNAQAGLGATQRGIESEGLAADKRAFEEARDNPYKMLQFQQSLLNGLPISAQNYQLAGTSDLQNVASGMTTVDKLLSTLGLSPTQTGAVPTAATGK
jgi:hypothetical protein